MQLLYFITTVTNQGHSARACGVQCSTERLVVTSLLVSLAIKVILWILGVKKMLHLLKIRKLQGAAMYKCKYISQWKREFPFIEAVKGDPYR